MNQGTYSLAASMVNQINRVDVISNNLANANTNGFKQEGLSEGSFNNYLKKAQEENFQPRKMSTVLNTVPKIDTKYINNIQGAITPTGNELDIALTDRNNFFKVRSQSGETLLSRDGSFHMMNNLLVNGAGQEVLDANNEPIAAVDGFASLVGLVKTDYTNLTKIGNNDYRILDNDKIENLATNDDLIIQGSLERSNVNSVNTMVSLIDAHRRFAQSQKAIESINEITQKAIEKIGRA